MKATPGALVAHNAQPLTTLATCWKITRRDSQVFGFTDHVRDLLVSGVTYKAATGLTASAIRTHGGLEVDDLEVSGALSSAGITEADVTAGRWDFAAVEVFEVNYANVAAGIRKMRRGWIGEVRRHRVGFVAEIRGMAQSLQQAFGQVFTPTCPADLGDAKCGFNLAPVTVTGSLTTVAGARQFSDTVRTEPDGWFDAGKFSFTSGLNAGLSREVKTWVGKVWALQEAFPYVPGVGDSYTVYPGCNKIIDQDCHVKFSNTANHRGQPRVPGVDRWASGK